MLTDVYIFYIFVYTYTCNDTRSVMLQINEDDDDDDEKYSYTKIQKHKTQKKPYEIRNAINIFFKSTCLLQSSWILDF